MNISRIILSAATIVACTTAFGRPAHTHTTKFAQPDGTEISLRLIGDERSSLTVTADSHEFPLVRRGNTFFYATVSPSGQLESTGIQAMPYSRLTPELRQALETSLTDRPLYTLSASSQSRIGTLTDNVTVPCRGNIKCLAVLVNYTDVVFNFFTDSDK